MKLNTCNDVENLHLKFDFSGLVYPVQVLCLKSMS